MARVKEYKVLGTLEEIEFGGEPNTALYSDSQEFAEAKDAFQREEVGKEFAGTGYWLNWMLPALEEMARAAAQAERDYRGLDAKKVEKLRDARRMADNALETVRGLVQNAVDLPRPVWNTEQQ